MATTTELPTPARSSLRTTTALLSLHRRLETGDGNELEAAGAGLADEVGEHGGGFGDGVMEQDDSAGTKMAEGAVFDLFRGEVEEVGGGVGPEDDSEAELADDFHHLGV